MNRGVDQISQLLMLNIFFGVQIKTTTTTTLLLSIQAQHSACVSLTAASDFASPFAQCVQTQVAEGPRSRSGPAAACRPEEQPRD